MDRISVKTPLSQLHLEGMPSGPEPGPIVGIRTLSPGREVVYHGNLIGGPRHGARGIVRQALGRRVVVDMGKAGVWHIPYYFLSVPSTAAA